CAAGAVLAASPRLRDIQQLDLTDNPLNAAGVAALLEGDWRELTDLRLSGTFAGDAGVQAITRSAALPPLGTLPLDARRPPARGRPKARNRFNRFRSPSTRRCHPTGRPPASPQPRRSGRAFRQEREARRGQGRQGVWRPWRP